MDYFGDNDKLAGERRMTILEQRVDVLRQDHEALKKCKNDYIHDNTKVQENIFKQLNQIQNKLDSQKSFIAGMLSLATGIIALAGYVINYLKNP